MALVPQAQPHHATMPHNRLDMLFNRAENDAFQLGDGTTAGYVDITMPIINQDLGFTVEGVYYQLAPGAGTAVMADHFDCSAFVDLLATEYVKVLLELTVAGVGLATLGAIATGATAAIGQARAVLPARHAAHAMVGWLEAGALAAGTDWDAVAGMASVGVTYHEGIGPAL